MVYVTFCASGCTHAAFDAESSKQKMIRLIDDWTPQLTTTSGTSNTRLQPAAYIYVCIIEMYSTLCLLTVKVGTDTLHRLVILYVFVSHLH